VAPKEFKKNPQKYVDLVCEQMIPLAAKRKLAKFVDVFLRQRRIYRTRPQRKFSKLRLNMASLFELTFAN
jgi:imidazolonepropionase